MPESIFNIDEARTELSKLLDRASVGEEIIIAKAGRPVAKLVPFEEPATRRKPGGWEGEVWVADDFDAPLPNELLAAFENREDG